MFRSMNGINLDIHYESNSITKKVILIFNSEHKPIPMYSRKQNYTLIVSSVHKSLNLLYNLLIELYIFN